MSTYRTDEPSEDDTYNERASKLFMRVCSVEGQLYSLGSTVTELRKKVDGLEQLLHELRRRETLS